MLSRTERLRCLDLLRRRAEGLSSITYHGSTEVLEVSPAEADRISIRCRSKGRDRNLKANHVVFAIGREPEAALISGPLLESQDRLCEEGLLHLAGDVKRGDIRQTAIAVGDGVKAAMDIFHRLRNLRK
jgi:thioredoxin reductase